VAAAARPCRRIWSWSAPSTQHELQHRFRVRAAFDAFVPGTPLY
jgi:hypothetical protein